MITPTVRIPADHPLSRCCKNLSGSDKVDDEDGKRSAEYILCALWMVYAFVLLFAIGAERIEKMFEIIFVLGLTDFALRFWRIRTSLLFVPVCLWSLVFCMFPVADRILTKLGM